MTRLSRGDGLLSNDDADVLASIAEDYYLRGSNQDAIAVRYRISRSYVSRLLRRARELGIVEISVNRTVRREPDLESAMTARFGLDRCVVVAVNEDTDDPADVLRKVGREGAQLLMEQIEARHTLALAWGTGVRAVVDEIKPGRARARDVVQLFGGLSNAPPEIMSGDLVPQAARALGASFERLHAPWIVESSGLARALVEQPDIAGTLRKTASADIAFVGIGAIGHGSSALLFNDTYLTSSELAELAASGAVGDICGRVFDRDGRACEVSFMSRVIGLDLDGIRRLPLTVGIAIGTQKHRAVKAAVTGGLVSALVTDASVAREVLRDERF